jgi:hypothetical protein
MAQKLRLLILKPQNSLAISLAAGLVFGLLVLTRYKLTSHFFYYNVPIMLPFAAFLLERVGQWQIRRKAQWLLDGLVLPFALLRAFVLVPWVSGHTLFLTYAIFSSRSWVTRLTASGVLVEVISLKFLAWGDYKTVSGGLALGLLAALLSKLLNRPSHSSLNSGSNI